MKQTQKQVDRQLRQFDLNIENTINEANNFDRKSAMIWMWLMALGCAFWFICIVNRLSNDFNLIPIYFKIW